MAIGIRAISLAALVTLGLGGLMAAWVSSPSSAPEPTISGEQRAQVRTLREVVDQLATRHRLRIVVDPAVRSDAPAPVAFDATFAALPVEAQLRHLFAGHELLLHHTADRGSGPRLAAAWVFARAEDVTVVARPAATAAAFTFAPVLPVAATPAAAETGRPAPRHAEAADAEAPTMPLLALRRQVEQDASDAGRMQALEALASHPEAGDAELRQLLEQLAAQPHTLLGEEARALLGARFAPATALAPEPVEP
ncbi:hypothetical protein [Variovorax sp. YR752]|uniref:hypothetical protein n=1 Tax=Variovorax sp. YR752 TaxID=1884383 RepID=UPI003137DF75